LDNKGQVSAEYLFLILIFLIILTTVTIPFATNSITASQNVSVTSDAETAVSTIANAVDLVYSNGPSSQRTVNVYIPQNNANLSYDGTDALDLSLTGIPVNANNTTATVPYVNATIPNNVPITITGNPIVTTNTHWHTFTISWPVGSTITININ
jgi:uncharacterized protein (UPF0333 family)